MRTGGAALRTRDGDRQLVVVRVLGDATAQPLPLAARVDVFLDLEDRRDDVRSSTHDPRVGRRGRRHGGP